MTDHHAVVGTPVGDLLLVGTASALRGVYFADAPHAKRAVRAGSTARTAPFVTAIGQLEQYFAGTRRAFDLALAPEGTLLQCAVWRELARIPYGETTTYGAIARAIGRPFAVRAVGAANGRNPLSIVVPCHRVIGKDGTLTGYAGGLPNKQALLALERRAVVTYPDGEPDHLRPSRRELRASGEHPRVVRARA